MKAKYYLLGILILFLGHSTTAQDNPCGIEGIVVEASNFQFAPAALEIEAGQTVVWVNVGGTHDVNGLASTLGEDWNNPETFYIGTATGNMDGVCLGSHTFTVEGTYDYDCSIGSHAANGMVGTIMVNPAPSTTTVVDIIVNSEDHTLLEVAVGAADLVDVLSGEGPFTVFAPTDEAFLALLAAADITMEELLVIPQFVDLLTYHIVGVNAYTAELSDGQMITTANGQNVTVSITADGVFINNAQMLVADIAADNGVVHVIDAVLLPPAPQTNTVVDIIANSEDHTLLEAALGTAGLVDALSGEGPFTVFAPTDDAVIQLVEALDITLEDFLALPYLGDFLLYHVVGAEDFSFDLNDGQIIETMQGEDVVIGINEDGLFINDAQVIVADLQADNGIVHVLEDVLLPSSVFPGSDDLPWSHDCNVDNCDSWVFGNGADIAGSPWQGVDLNFDCSTEGPAGPYNQWAGGTGDFTAAPPMNSTTGSNGLLIVDSDLSGTDANYSAAWIENSWVQTAEPINCSTTEFIRMSFQTRYRCWDNGSSDDSEKCLVEISRDGVNWPDISTFSEVDGVVDYGDGVLVPSRWEVFPGYETGSETDNPSFIDLDVSSAAGGQEQVWIRFRWSGTWGYSWEIDDILLLEAPMNDLRVESYVSTTDYANTGVYELGAIPIGQLTNYQAGVTVKNIGINPQSGVQLNLSVDGTTIGTSPFYYLDYDAEETLQAAYALNGLGLGSHTLEFEVSADSEDDYPENNDASRTIEVTEHQLGRDNGSMTGLFPSDGTDDFIALNPFVIYEDATIYAIDVAIAAGSESGTPIVAHLFDASDGNFLAEQYGGLMASSYELNLDGTWTNQGDETDVTWYTLVLEDPIAVSAGQSIAAGFEHYGGSNVQIWESQFTFDQTSFTYGPFGSGSAYDWYYTNEAPMVRLNFNPNAVNSGAGCTDSEACNYNPNAVEDNGSCEYETCAGCLDEMACNFDSGATISSPELCQYPGCLDSSATNYDSSAGCEGECIYLTYDCASIGESAWGNEAMGLFPDWQGAMHGVAWAGEWVFNVPLSIVEPSSGVTYSIHHVNWTSVEGLPAWLEEADYTMGELAAESQHCIAASGTPTEPGWHEIISTGEVFISIFGQPFSIGEQSFSAWLEVAENPNPIPGCTYATAQNFVAFATLDDGSCEFAGCTDPEAGNFNPLATIDDGSCGECDLASDATCPTDIDNDGIVSVSDLLLLLGDFGSPCLE